MSKKNKIIVREVFKNEDREERGRSLEETFYLIIKKSLLRKN